MKARWLINLAERSRGENAPPLLADDGGVETEVHALVEIERQAKLETARRTVRILEHKQKADLARDSFIDFIEYTKPDPNDPDNPQKTQYRAQPFHRILAEKMVEVATIPRQRLIVTMPPRHGKSEQTSRFFPAWYAGKFPDRSLILGAYNQGLADEFGRAVRDIMNSGRYSLVFPSAKLKTGSQSADRLETTYGGIFTFVGRRGTTTGRGAHVFIIDDPIKDRKEADSETYRKDTWDWFLDVVHTRLASDVASVIIVLTRWHEDDIVGRLTDKNNINYDEAEAEGWQVINIPALSEGEDDPLGRPFDAPLWPEQFGFKHLDAFRRRAPRTFSALYQQRPSPVDGDYFKAANWQLYDQKDLPVDLRKFGAADFALTQDEQNDRTCMGIVGIAPNGCIYVLDLWWERKKINAVVDQLFKMQKQWSPIRWWAESAHIEQSIAPLLDRLARDDHEHLNFWQLPKRGDKAQKAAPIMGWYGRNKVLFPRGAPWLGRARDELLKFDSAPHDDFVDFLSLIGRGLSSMSRPGDSALAEEQRRLKEARPGTLRWIRQQDKLRREGDGTRAEREGW